MGEFRCTSPSWWDMSLSKALLVLGATIVVAYLGWRFGGDNRFEVTFVWQGQTLSWQSQPDEEPWLLQRLADVVFVVSETWRGSGDPNSLVLHRYRGGDWSTLPLDQLPPQMAVCNLSSFGPRWHSGTRVAKEGREIRVVNDGVVQEKLDKLFLGRER